MPTKSPRTPAKKTMTEKEESLRIIIDEQRRDYDYLLHIYNRMRATESILLTATFGILAYLYYAGDKNAGIMERLFVPSEDYGMVIYTIAAAFFTYGLLKLMMTVFGKNWWMTAYETSKECYEYTTLETLLYVKKRYDACAEFNGRKYSERKENLTNLFYYILISAIILIIIKTLDHQ